MKKERRKKQIVSILMVFVMVVSLIQSLQFTNVLAAEGSKADCAYVAGTLNLLDSNWASWSENFDDAKMDCVSTNYYVKTFTFDALKEDTTIKYKVAFDGSWDRSIGKDGGDISATIPAGSTSFTVVCDDNAGKVYDSVNKVDGAETVSLIGTVRCQGDAADWVPANTDFDMVFVKDGFYISQLTLNKGTYKYQYVINHETWSDMSDVSLEVPEDNTVVTFLCDRANNTMYDSISSADKIKSVLEKATTSSFDKVNITVHFKNVNNWDKVNAFISEGSSWSAIEGYSYAGTWPGAQIVADEKNANYYSFSITKNTSVFNLILNNDNGAQTGNINISDFESENVEYWINYDGENTTYTTSAPEGWVVGETYQAPIKPEINSDIVSPVVNDDNTVTVSLDATGTYAGSKKVALMGNLAGTDWNTGLEMKLNDDEKVYTVTTPVQSAGVYEYKFKIDENWITDPANEELQGGNSKVVVAGLAAANVDVKRGVETKLPETLKLFAKDGTSSDATVTYSVKDTDKAAAVTIKDGKITVSEDSTFETVTLLAKSGDNTSTVTVNVKDEVYTYNIYFYDADSNHMSVEAADLWAWEVDGGNLGPIDFSSVEKLSDGNNWLKATLETSAKNFGFIPRSKGAWNWQTANHYYNNESCAESTDIYVVMDDDKTYTELPEIKEVTNDYLVVEYIRPEGDYEGWNIFSWNTGFGSSTELYTEEINGKHYIIVPVKDTGAEKKVSFCMRHTTEDNEWESKDGGDHCVTIPADQSVVHAVFTQGKGITFVYPYNKGYEMNGQKDEISFLYRDDSRVANATEGNIEKVEVVVNGIKKAMEYDEDTERYVYTMKDCKKGDYAYYYEINGKKVLDAFNNKTTTYNDEECSVFTFKKFDNLTIKAELSLEKMNYSQNNVLSVKLEGADAKEFTKAEIANVKADLSQMGLQTLDVDPEIMELSISATNNTEAGKKEIPVTMTDVYGNVYKDTAKVELVKKSSVTAGSSDWDEAIIYFAVTDRFYDGSSKNNDGVNKEGSLSYHGGDFAGLTQKLDYLEDLGINTIWITPIVENSDVTTEKDGETIESTGYHGYWASDFEKLNPHLGTEKEFATLISEAHKRDIKLMVDIVVNHAGYNTEDYFNSIIKGEDGSAVKMLRDSSNTISGDDVRDSLAGLPDFVTENEAVRNQIIEWQTNWVEKYDIDYYRVDTVKHVDSTTWAAFKNSLTKVNPEFKLIGEYSGAGYANTAGELGTGSMDSLLDFDFNDKAQAFVSGDISGVESFLSDRNTSINNTATMGAFLSSHDEDGLVYKLINQNKYSEEEALTLFRVAASLQLTAKGQAVIYYGEELGQYGADNYPYQTNRYDFDWDELEKQKADSSSMYNHYKKLLAIRNSNKELFARGDRTTIEANNEAGYDVFSRTYGKKSLYFALNVKNESQTVKVAVKADAGTILCDLYSGEEYVVADDNTVTVIIPAAKAGGTVVLEVKENENKDEVKDENKDEVKDENKDEVKDENKDEIQVNDCTKVENQIFVDAVNKGLDVVIPVVDDKGNELYTWTFDNENIDLTVLDKIGSLDLTVNFVTAKEKKIQSSVNHLGKAMFIEIPNYDGKLPGKATLTVPVGNKYKNGDKVYLYYYNEKTGKVEKVGDAITVTNNKVSITIDHCSVYFLSDKDDVATKDSAKNVANTNKKPTSAKTSDNAMPIVWLFALILGAGITSYEIKKMTKKRA